MRTYTSLLAELRKEDGLQVATHFNRFKAALKKADRPREIYCLSSDACKKAIACAAENILLKSENTGVDDRVKLVSGIAVINTEYEQKFVNMVRDYLHYLETPVPDICF